MMYLIIAALIIGLILLLSGDKKPTRQPIQAKSILTEREKIMFARLLDSLPHAIILTQVSFSAFMTADGFHTRNLFNRKMIDFVILNQDLDVILMIELDDATHIGREHIDAERDALLKEAGYKIIRYKHLPEVHELKKDLRFIR